MIIQNLQAWEEELKVVSVKEANLATCTIFMSIGMIMSMLMN